ncbi:RPII140-upstream gene protein [Fopius arisanus]|uniref:Complex I assembly factor TIMMDC1, mitochondrial n=1 Tax=Fopius arisanus TaxID=64838 RepID=A0A0C9R514_9HYME|nr:PREDICTED: RPII140-upstream gene protein [Fopius arisanus]
MFSTVRRIPVSRLALFGLFDKSADIVTTPGYEELSQKYTGMTAVRRMLTPDQYGELSPELVTAVHMSATSTLMGILYGAVIQGREAWYAFIENNQATQFANHLEAKKLLQDKVTLAMGRGALKWGYRIGAFSTMFIFINTCIAAYRGEPGILEYVGAGVITGGLFKVNLGPKGMVAGSVVGGFLGFLGGAASLTLLYLTGYTMDDIEKVQHDMHASRNEAVRNAMKYQLLDEYEKLEIDAAKKDEKLNPSSPLDSVAESESPTIDVVPDPK